MKPDSLFRDCQRSDVFIRFSLILALMLTLLINHASARVLPPVKVRLHSGDRIEPHQLFRVNISLEAPGIVGVSLSIELPQGWSHVSGDLDWAGDLTAGTPKSWVVELIPAYEEVELPYGLLRVPGWPEQVKQMIWQPPSP